MLIGNSDIVIYNFRFEFIKELINKNYDVYILLPYGKRVDELIDMGCHFIDISLDRHGKNIFKDLGLFNKFYFIIKKILPDVIFTYTIKPNIYGCAAAGINKIPCIPTITGLGSSLKNNKLMALFISNLYKAAFRKVPIVFFQNKENRDFFYNQGIWKKKSQLVMGSGVNLDKYFFLEYPKPSESIKFLFIGRIMREKGINEYLEMIENISKKYKNIEFHLCGFLEEDYEEKISAKNALHEIIYHGMVDDVRYLLKEIHCVVLPSYHEGMSNALLEAASCGRPLIASDIPGCKEIITENENGFLVQPRNTKSLTTKIEQFILLDYDSKRIMGGKSRKIVEKEFDRKNIIKSYINQINLLTED